MLDSHDTFGHGHLHRRLAIAEGLAAVVPGSRQLLGSLMEWSPDRISYLNAAQQLDHLGEAIQAHFASSAGRVAHPANQLIGRPTVSLPLTGIPEIIDDRENGRSVSRDDHLDLARRPRKPAPGESWRRPAARWNGCFR